MIGSTISHYKILEKLGGGGMGIVYKAEDTKLKRSVALKFLPPELSRDEEAKERFVHEAQAASALDHPNICTIYEINETDDGQMFIAMAYYEGETLKKKVASGQLSVDSVLDIALQIAQGLTKAHEKGIVHRDIKPANVFVTNDGLVKILDFGLAKLAGRTRLTKTGMTVGTVAYMSPEQVQRIDADHRTDIWSLGVVMYEMLTGKLPFEGEYEQAIMYAIVNIEPPPIISLRADVPSALESIVMKAMANEPAERYQLMNEMLADLKSTNKISEFRPVRTIKRRLPKKKRSFLYGGLAAFPNLLMAMGLYFFSPRRETIDSIAVLPLANLSGDANQEYFVDGMTEALISVLGQIEALRVISRTSVMQYKTAPKPLPEIAKELNVDAIVEGSAMTTGDRVNITVRLIEARTEKRLWSQSFERELRDVLNLQQEMALAITGEIELRVTRQEQARLKETRTVAPEAYKLYLWGMNLRVRETTESIPQAINLFEQAIKIDPDFAQAYAALVVPYFLMHFFGLMSMDEARSKARQAATKALELDETLSEAHVAMAMIRYLYDWDWPSAEEEFKHAIALNPGNGEAHREYALFLCRRGRPKEGLAAVMHALDVDPLSEIVNAKVAEIYVYNRQYDMAIEHCGKVLQLNPHFAYVQYMLGFAYLAKGQYEEAISVYETEAIVAFTKGTPDYLGVLGCAYAWSGKREKALKLLGELKNLWKQGYNTSIFIALIYVGLGEKDKALDMLEWNSNQNESPPFHDWVLLLWFDSINSEPRYQALLKKCRACN